MSKKAVREFRAAVLQRTDLQSQILDQLARDVFHPVDFARTLGYQFSSDELRIHIFEHRHDLTAFEREVLERSGHQHFVEE